jgi:hypothetical protein
MVKTGKQNAKDATHKAAGATTLTGRRDASWKREASRVVGKVAGERIQEKKPRICGDISSGLKRKGQEKRIWTRSKRRLPQISSNMQE